MDRHSGRPDEEPAAPAAYGSGASPWHSGTPAQPVQPADAGGQTAPGIAQGPAVPGGAGVFGAVGASGASGTGARPPLPVRPLGRKPGAGAPRGAAGRSTSGTKSPRTSSGDAGATPPQMRIPYGTPSVTPAPGAEIPRIPPTGSIARASVFPPGAGRPDAAATGNGGELELAPRRPLDLRGGRGRRARAAAAVGDGDGGAGSGPQALGRGAGLPELPGGSGVPELPGGSGVPELPGGSGIPELSGGSGADGGTPGPSGGADAAQEAGGGGSHGTAAGAPASDGFDAFGTGRAASGNAGIPRARLPASVERALTSEPFDAFGVGRTDAAERTAADVEAAPAQEPPRAGSGSFDGFAAGSPGARRRTPQAPPVRGTSAENAGAAESAVEETAVLPRTTRPARDPLGVPEIAASSGSTRVRRIVTTDFVVTVNPVDGSEVVPRPPEEARVPVRRSTAERVVRMNAARPAPPPGPPAPELPLLEREEERERLVGLLSRGRTVRVTGASGSGRTALLDAVAAGCGDLAPEGVLRLSGYHRTCADLMHDLYTQVYGGEDYRPSPAELTRLLADVGALIVVDDLEFGGSALEELRAAVPECALLLAATPDVPAPAAESAVEEVLLPGLSRAACLNLLVLAAGRPLAEDETAWAADLWFESEGLPLRFVQAGALLRQRDAMRPPVAPESADWEDSVWEKGAVTASAPDAPDLPDLSAFDVFDDAAGAGADSSTGAGTGDLAGRGGAGASGGRAGAGADGYADFTDVTDVTAFDGFGGGSGAAGGRAAGGVDGSAWSGAGDGIPSIPLGGTATSGSSDTAGAGDTADAGGGAGTRSESQPQPAGEAPPLPSLAESAAPAEILASRLGDSAREALAFAVALDGECPNPSHLPALVGDTHGDAALGELTAAGLAVPVAGHFRLAAGVAHQLTAVLQVDGELSEVQAHTAALHYTWWAGHRSVTPVRAAAESEAILAAMAACARGGNASAAVLLARTVAPVFAAALAWGAWERALRIGQEAARQTGEVTEEAYFLHELGVLELCTGRYASARVELEASLALRGVLADRQGSVVGRRTLALVEDCEAARGGSTLPGVLTPYGPPATEPDGVTTQLPAMLDATMPVVISKVRPDVPRAAGAAGAAGARRGRPAPAGLRRLAVAGRRRTAVVAGAGVLLVAALGTLVTLGTGSAQSETPDNGVQPVESTQPEAPASTDSAEPPASTTAAPTTPASPSASATTPPPTTPRTAAPTTAGAPATTSAGTLTTAPTPPAGGGGGHGRTPNPTAPTTTNASSTGSTPSDTPSSTSQTPTSTTSAPSPAQT